MRSATKLTSSSIGEPPANRDTPPAAARTTKRRTSSSVIFGYLERYGLLGLLAAVIVFFSLLPASATLFASQRNLDHLLADQTVVTVAAFAVVIPLIAGHFDVSIGSVIGLSSLATAASMSRYHLPVLIAVLIGVAVGCTVGAVNGILVAYLKLNSIIVTLAATIIIQGIVEWYTNGVSITTGISSRLTDFGSDRWLSVPRPAVLLVVVALLASYLLGYTPFGRNLVMIGNNLRASRLVGVPVDRVTFASFVLAGGLAGVAGVVLCARTGGANPQDGPSYLFPALVAAFLGTTAIRPGRFNVGGTVLAVFFVAVTVSGLSLSGAQPWVQPVFNGVALLVAVGLARVLAVRRGQADA